LDIQKMLVNLY